ncbi:hypothetical protein PGT21_014359 [Puccinia graminis f. sp. tritici]|uniref:Uncharacterized protein n=1 Tax=Puccinia graminis f. sp. tritici TaxID=56615 RepID=A0A5B0NRM4_PUCGR|nr:hypothetical protein PGT21_014359 [Puccinia graminis f. sp. tritici]
MAFSPPALSLAGLEFKLNLPSMIYSDIILPAISILSGSSYPPHLKLVTVFHHHRSSQYLPSPHFFTTAALVPVVLRFSFVYKPRRPNFPNRPSRLTA